MKYLSLDIETTGLEESWCQVLEIGAVYADTLDFITPVDQLPSWSCRLYYDVVVGQPYALWLNAELIKDMDKQAPEFNYLHPDQVWGKLTEWIGEVHKVKQKLCLTGKNVAMFDYPFLRRLPGWDRSFFRHRVIDPGQTFMLPGDDAPPDLKTCIARAGLPWDESKHHKAVEDARMVVSLNRVGLSRQWKL